MKRNKIWKVMGRKGSFTDSELIGMISRHELSDEDKIYTSDFDAVKIKDCAYSFYYLNKEEGK